MRLVAATTSAGLLALLCIAPVSRAGASPAPRLYQRYELERANARSVPAQAANPTPTPIPGLNRVAYHSGGVMPGYHAYTIFWTPAPHSIEPTYEALIDRWFDDVSGSLFLNVAAQYFQFFPPQYVFANVTNTSSLAGTWVDTGNAYPHAGTPEDPLLDADIQAEVQRAITKNGWPTGGNDVEYFVYTASGVESCDSSMKQFCTPGVPGVASGQQYLAYHSAIDSAQTTVYANMPYAATWVSLANFVSPNGVPAADIEISVTSHEQFESMTDPAGEGWFSDSDGEEIGDLCEGIYGTVGADGSNLTLNGNPYFVQTEWSNAQASCASGLLCSTQPQTGCKPTTQSRASVLQLKVNALATRNALTWKWSKGAATSLADFGDPLASTTYAVCVYDEIDGHPTLVMDVVAPAGSGWSKTATGFKYANKTPTGNQPQNVTLHTTAAGKATIIVNGKGDGLPLPALPLEQTPKVVVQMQNTAGGCWEADYSLATKNTSAQFKAKSD